LGTLETEIDKLMNEMQFATAFGIELAR